MKEKALKETQDALDGSRKISDLPGGGSATHSIADQKGPLGTDSLDEREPEQHPKKKQSIRSKHKHHKSCSALNDDLEK